MKMHKANRFASATAAVALFVAAASTPTPAPAQSASSYAYNFLKEAGCQLLPFSACDVLDGRVSIDAAVDVLERRRRAAFAAKWRFNRTLRGLVASSAGVTASTHAARIFPSLFASVIRYAGDCHVRDQGPGIRDQEI